MVSVAIVRQIPLSRGYSALVDDDDFEWLSKLRSRVSLQSGLLRYATTLTEGGERMMMHRLIMGLPKRNGFLVHHVNGDGLDNRRANLRIVDNKTHSQHHAAEHPSRIMAFKNVTTVSLPPETASIFKEAARYYRFESLAGFFRTCGELLVDHYRRGDSLNIPLCFHNDNDVRKGKKSRE